MNAKFSVKAAETLTLVFLLFFTGFIICSCEKDESPEDGNENIVIPSAPVGGLWEGSNISFYVSDDGSRITGVNSPLENNRSVGMIISVNSTSSGVSAVKTYIYADIIIKDDSTFEYEDDNIVLQGKFTSSDTAGRLNKADGSVSYSGEVNRGSGSDPTLLIEGSLSWNACPSLSLSYLTISSGDLSPVFSSSVYNYTANVGYNISNITITPIAYNPQATIFIDSVLCNSGNSSQSICLDVGENTIPIEVKAPDGTTKSYTIRITRVAANAALSALTMSTGQLEPEFSGAGTAYTATVNYDVSGITVTPTSVDPGATITVNSVPCASGSPSQSISLNVGENNILIKVTGPDESVNEYLVVVTRRGNAYLSDLAVSSGTLTPTFSKNVMSYEATVENSIESITVTPEAEDDNATIYVNSVLCTSGNPSQTISLDEGENHITIEVIAQDGTTNDYVLHVTRTPAVIPERLVLISITDGGSNYWHVQFSQNIKGLKVGVYYTITFDAYASQNVTIMCDINQGGGSYQQVLNAAGISPFFHITTSKTTFSEAVISTIADEGNGVSALQFNLGLQGAYDIYIDNVSVTADGEEQINNGDFSLPITTGWNILYLEGTGAATVSIIEP